jgi:two-component system, sensor histidine kinase and response regulator
MAERERTAPSILVVDDTAENLRLLTNLFREHRYEVRPVPSGKLALQAVALDPPDLILLDINMPDMNGFDVCDALKQNEAWMDIPVIFVSALDEVFDKVRAFSVGGVDYITKPFQVEEVLARVHTHLVLRRTQRELEQRIQRLRELESMRESMFQMIAHDLRSPAWGIEQVVARLAAQARERLEPEAAVQLEHAQKAAVDLGRMVSSLLDVSRIETNNMPIHVADVDLRGLAASAAANAGLADPSRAVHVDIEAGTLARCDAELVRRVLENLVGNGLKHTPPGSTMRVRCARDGEVLRVEVADRGPGVPVEDRERIFDKFGTVQSRNRYATSGLGLAFCRLAVEAHGGRIGVADEEGGGSRFWFELPAVP